MRLARIRNGNEIHQVAFKDGLWCEVVDIFAQILQFTGVSFPESEVTFLTPTEPKVVLGMAHNGTKDELSRAPQSFHKSVRSVISCGETIFKDETLGRVDVECELVTVIRKRARNLTLDNAMEYVLGFSIGNDVTAAEQTVIDNLLLQTKNGDGFTPYGPWIETELPNPDDLSIFVNVNGSRVISTSTNKLARGVVEQLIFITRYMTLDSGDIILGGSPTSWYAVNSGDIAEMEIEGIGTLSNPVKKL